MNSDVLMSSDDVAILFAALVIGGLALAALISMPVLELPDDDYPQGPFRHSSDDEQDDEDEQPKCQKIQYL